MAMSLYSWNDDTNDGVILRGGRVVDPFGGGGENAAVVIQGDAIRAMCPEPEAAALFPAARAVDLDGLFVSAGFIDMHTHVDGCIGLPADEIGVYAGITTLVDCGSAGADTFDSFLNHVVLSSETEIFAFLHIARQGLSVDLREAADLALLDIDAAASVATGAPGVIRGIKVRIDTSIIGGNSLVPAIRAKKSALACSLPLMIHIANEPPLLRDMLELLDPGDIVAHCFNGRTAKIVTDAGGIRPCVLAARERGVFFDVAHGGGSFSFDTARKATAARFAPDSVSSDLHSLSRKCNLFSLAVTMSKFLALGYSLPEIIRLTTAAPARILGLEDSHGRLAPGRKADLTIFALDVGRYAFADSQSAIFEGDTLIRPIYTIKAGKPFTCNTPQAALGEP